jgi:hypothetical protein
MQPDFNMKNFLGEIASYLATSLGGNTGELIFVEQLPEKEHPSKAVAIIQQAGLPGQTDQPVKTINTQILCRDSSIPDALNLAQTTFNALNMKSNILATYTGRCEPTSMFGIRYNDANNRVVYPLNFRWRMVYMRG